MQTATRRRRRRAGARRFNPYRWHPAVELFLSHRLLPSITNDPRLGCWPDKAGLRHATQTGSPRPSLRSRQLNGRPAVDFDGSADCMVFAELALTGPFTVVVGSQLDSATNQPFIGKDALTNDYLVVTNTTAAGMLTPSDAGVAFTHAARGTSGEWYVDTFTRDDVDATAHWLNRVQSSGTDTLDGTLTLSTICRCLTTLYLNGQVGLVCVWSAKVPAILPMVRSVEAELQLWT